MNIEHKKTALDDDSLLYQKRDDSLSKKDTSNLTRIQKIGYFKDYYLKAILVILLIAAISGSLIYNIFFREQINVLNVAFINDAYIIESDQLQADLRDYYELTSKDEYISLEHYNLDDYTAQMKLTTLLGAQSLDMIICSEDVFEKYAQMGAFVNLSEALPAELYEKFEGQIIEASEVETDVNFEVIETYPAEPYGIDITENAVYRAYGGSESKSILGITGNVQHLDNIIYFLEYLTAEE